MVAAPDPSSAATLAEFIERLGELRVWAGNPSFRVLARRTGPVMRPAQQVSASTVADVFRTNRRRLNMDLLVAVLRALGLDEEAVGRWRQAYVRVQRGADTAGPAGVLRQLPAGLATFTGRERELRALFEVIDAADATTSAGAVAVTDGGASVVGPRPSAPTVVVSAIEGMGGVGKTQLAVHAAHELVRAGRYPDAQFYVNLCGFDPEQPQADPAAVLGSFLQALRVPAERIPHSRADRAAMFRDRLYGRKVLILLDNAADEEQVRDLIPATPGCLVLITSRRTLAGLDAATHQALDVFSTADAVKLLSRIAGAERVDAEPEAAEEIVRACGQLPLGVALAAARLHSRPAWRLADLAELLRAAPLSAVSAGRRALRPVLELSYRALEPQAQRVFRLLALHPGRDVTAEPTAALAGIEVAVARECLELLTDEHLLQQRQPLRYEFHDLLRAFAREVVMADEPESVRAAAVDRVLEWYLMAADEASRVIPVFADLPPVEVKLTRCDGACFGTEAEAVEWCRREVDNLTAAVVTAHEHGAHAICARLAYAVSRYLYAETRWSAMYEVAQIGLKSAEAAGAADETGVLHRVIGDALCGQKLPRSADEHYAAATDIFRHGGNQAGLVSMLVRMMVYVQAVGRRDEAFELAAEALSIARELDDKRSLAKVLNNRAVLFHADHRPAEALKDLLEIQSILRETSESQFALGLYVRNLGFTNLVLGDFSAAEEALTEAAERFHAAGLSWHRMEGIHGIARAQYGQGKVEQARATAAAADQVLDGLDPDRAAWYRERIKDSPLGFVESTEIDGAARAWTPSGREVSDATARSAH